MKTLNAAPVLERFVGSLSECSTAGTGRQFAALKADHELRAGIDYVTGRCNLGLLTALEEVECGTDIACGTFFAIANSQAPQLPLNSRID